MLDIAWAAGIFEGEGHCRPSGRGTQVSVTQKDTWLLERLKALFGGHITKPSRSSLSHWDVSGARARGFLMTIYKFQSARRKAQISAALGVGKTLLQRSPVNA